MDARTLSLPISTLNLNQPCCVGVGTWVSEAIHLMQSGRFGCILVVDEQQHLVGIITDRDLLVHIMGKGLNPANVKVDDIMTSSPESLRANDPIAFALNRMHLGHYRHIPLIVSDGERIYPVGMVSSKDILNHVATFLEANKEE